MGALIVLVAIALFLIVFTYNLSTKEDSKVKFINIIQCGNCGHIHSKLMRYCPRCGKQHEKE